MARIGEIKCCNPACTCTDVAVHKTAGGRLSARCHKCQTERWAPVGTKAHRDMQAQTVLDDLAPVEQEAQQEQPTPNPTPKPKASVFSLGSL